MEFKKLALSAAISSALLLTACGGGSSDGTGTASPSSPTAYTVSGTAAKGIIINGVVNAYELVAGEWQPVGNTTTGSQGEYTLTLGSDYKGGPLKIAVTAGTDTQMKCDDSSCGDGVAFGDPVSLASGFQLDTVLPSVTANRSDVPVTPYTHMAAARVDEQLKADPSQDGDTLVNQAMSAVSKVVNFDVSATPVVDVTDAAAMQAATAEQQRAAVLGAAVMKLATADKPIEDVLQELGDSFEDGTLDGSDVTELTQAWSDTLDDTTVAGELDDSAKATLQAGIDSVTGSVDENGAYTPVASDNLGDTDVAQAKKLVSDTRSFIYNIVETDFDSPMNALGLDVDAAAQVFNRDSAAMTEILGLGIEQMLVTLGNDESLQTKLENGETISQPVEIKAGEQTLGTLTLSVDQQAGMQASLKGELKGTSADARTVSVDVTLDSNFDITKVTETGTDQTSFTLSLAGSLSDGSTSMAIKSGTVAATLSAPVVFEGESDNLQEVLTSLELKDLALQLKAGDATFDGQAGISLIQANADKVSKGLYDGAPLLTLKSVDLAGAFTTTAGKSVSAKLGLELANSDTFDLLAFLNQDSVVHVYLDDAISAEQLIQLQAATQVANAAGGWDLNYGQYSYTDWQTGEPVTWQHAGSYDWSDMTGYGWHEENYLDLMAIFDPVTALKQSLTSLPGSQVLNSGVYVEGWQQDGATVRRGHVWGEVQLSEYQETDANFLQAKLSTSLDLSGIEGLPEAHVSAVIDRNQLQGGDATLVVKWDGEQYTFQLDNVDVKSQTGALTVTNPDGVSLQLKDIAIADKSGSGALYVGEKKVADVTTLDSGAVKISYIDGTFETLQ